MACYRCSGSNQLILSADAAADEHVPTANEYFISQYHITIAI